MSPPIRYREETLKEFLFNQSIATMDQLKQVLGTDTQLTVLRKLKKLGYLTSYSHRGRYYTLEEISRFDEIGLWSYDSVWFSSHGTLIRTLKVLVETSEAGYQAQELEQIVHVSVKDPLRKLCEDDLLHREKVCGYWVYCSSDLHHWRTQIACRTEGTEETDTGVVPDEMRAAIILFFSLLDEQKRRLYAGLESLKWGYGGDRRIANLLGLNEKTVARGRKELLDEDILKERIRKSGGGRRPLKKGLLR